MSIFTEITEQSMAYSGEWYSPVSSRLLSLPANKEVKTRRKKEADDVLRECHRALTVANIRILRDWNEKFFRK